MTIKQYIKKYGWEIECNPQMCRAMSVNIGFINDENREDQTQLDIMAYDEGELSNLFKDFCRENRFPQNTVTYVGIVQMADNMEELE